MCGLSYTYVCTCVLQILTGCLLPPTLALTLSSYEFKDICQWFAERCDLILLLFDAHKLDISDEFQKTVEKLKGHEDKIRYHA